VSLTSPSGISGSDPVTAAKGFGAPLWVVLLSVLGSGIITIRIIVEGIKNRVNFNDRTEVRSRIQVVIVHQFFIFFSPVGAIFVYQILVAIGAASNQMTVAFVALASGVSLNLVLDKARTMTGDLFTTSTDTTTG
jgi:hypothetical protein